MMKTNPKKLKMLESKLRRIRVKSQVVKEARKEKRRNEMDE